MPLVSVRAAPVVKVTEAAWAAEAGIRSEAMPVSRDRSSTATVRHGRWRWLSLRPVDVPCNMLFRLFFEVPRYMSVVWRVNDNCRQKPCQDVDVGFCFFSSALRAPVDQPEGGE
ncbi:hypothetical protein GCM10009540_02970 [Streptomyces turgidiscabies]